MILKDKIIIEDYRAQKNDFIELGNTVNNILTDLLKENGIKLFSSEHRVKTEKSLMGKLNLKGDKYASLDDITDILGMRLICFFSDEVDKVAELIAEHFVIDWDNSVDKRTQLDPRMFGYMSIHFICSLPADAGYPENLTEKRFEIQVRSVLQHVWADIEHDMGYKSQFGVPYAVKRSFSKIASLLEIADEQFVQTRNDLKRYTDDTRARIAADTAEDLPIDTVSLNEYIRLSHAMNSLLNEISDLSDCAAEIYIVPADVYISQLKWLGIKTIGALGNMLARNHDLALKLAARTLKGNDIDTLVSNVGLRYLCRAELLAGGYTEAQAAEFLNLSYNNAQRSKNAAKSLFRIKGSMI
ncbi:MAG: hypothetical protein IJH37_06970 [Clostridia bacterium]|nr:hypothetical protein [Clostridia bacterium]